MHGRLAMREPKLQYPHKEQGQELPRNMRYSLLQSNMVYYSNADPFFVFRGRHLVRHSAVQEEVDDKSSGKAQSSKLGCF